MMVHARSLVPVRLKLVEANHHHPLASACLPTTGLGSMKIDLLGLLHRDAPSYLNYLILTNRKSLLPSQAQQHRAVSICQSCHFTAWHCPNSPRT